MWKLIIILLALIVSMLTRANILGEDNYFITKLACTFSSHFTIINKKGYQGYDPIDKMLTFVFIIFTFIKSYINSIN